jgi:hypothetical protein
MMNASNVISAAAVAVVAVAIEAVVKAVGNLAVLAELRVTKLAHLLPWLFCPIRPSPIDFLSILSLLIIWLTIEPTSPISLQQQNGVISQTQVSVFP